MVSSDINLLAVLVAAVVNVVIGSLWFSPLLFARGWMAGIGKTAEQVEKDFSPLKIVGAFAGALFSALTLAWLIDLATASTLFKGALLGFAVGVGLLSANNGVHYLMEGRPRRLFAISNGFDLVTLAVAGGILGAWS